jgi:hypothetical protein
LAGVVQHIDKHHNVKTAFAVRYRRAIKCVDRYNGIVTLADVDPPNGNVRALLSNQASESAITATNIEHFGTGGNESGTPVA